MNTNPSLATFMFGPSFLGSVAMVSVGQQVTQQWPPPLPPAGMNIPEATKDWWSPGPMRRPETKPWIDFPEERPATPTPGPMRRPETKPWIDFPAERPATPTPRPMRRPETKPWIDFPAERPATPTPGSRPSGMRPPMDRQSIINMAFGLQPSGAGISPISYTTSPASVMTMMTGKKALSQDKPIASWVWAIGGVAIVGLIAYVATR